MRIAVPLFGSRVSPRFDCAQIILFVALDGEGNVQRRELSATTWTPAERINRLIHMDVETVICGGIDRWSAESLRSAGIRVYDSITGEADEALAALWRGELQDTRQARAEGIEARFR